MISYVKGIVDSVDMDKIVVERGGIGFNIFMPQSDLEMLNAGEEVKIYTHLYVREDAVQLFGFLTPDSLQMYRLLLGVSGVGPKGALAIISACPQDTLQMAIISGDSKAISRAPGIGNKTAQKIILELKDKLDFDGMTMQASNRNLPVNTTTAQNDAVEALISLGYSAASALNAVKAVENSQEMETEALLKEALKHIF